MADWVFYCGIGIFWIFFTIRMFEKKCDRIIELLVQISSNTRQR